MRTALVAIPAKPLVKRQWASRFPNGNPHRDTWERMSCDAAATFAR